MSKSILTLYHKPDWDWVDPTPSPNTKLMYAVWHDIAKKRKIEIFRSSMEWYNNGYFTKGWHLAPTGYWERYSKKIVPSVVYDRAIGFDLKTGEPNEFVNVKKEVIGQRLRMVNAPQFTRLVDNKLYQAAFFRDVMSRTTFAPPGTVYKQPKNKRIVIKALGGLGGDYVQITSKTKVVINQRSILQEFVDGKRGNNVQDFRIHFVGDQPQYFYTRVAPKGSFFTNVHMGASFYWLKPEDFPQVWESAQKVARRFAVFPKRLFALDFMINAKTKKPVLIEINSQPGTKGFTVEQHERLLSNMTDHFFS